MTPLSATTTCPCCPRAPTCSGFHPQGSCSSPLPTTITPAQALVVGAVVEALANLLFFARGMVFSEVAAQADEALALWNKAASL